MKILLDKILKMSIVRQLTILLLLMVVIGSIYGWIGLSAGFSYEGSTDKKLDEITKSLSQAEQVVKEQGIKDKVIYILSRLIDPGNIEDSEDKMPALILSIVGWLLCGGFFIAILTNGYFERIKKIEDGTVRYKMKDHIVIFGNNDITLSLIKHIRRKDGRGLKNKIVVFTSEDNLNVRNKFKAYLNKEEEKDLFIFHGDFGSSDHLAELCLPKADSIYVLGDKNDISVDSGNINCVKIISDIIHKQNKDVNIDCYLLLDNLNIFDLLQDNSMEKEIKEVLNVKSFNMFQTWAGKLFSNDCVSNDQDYRKIYNQIEKLSHHKVNDYDEDVLRFVIFGYNRMGKAILNQITRVLHLGSKRKTVVTVIDELAEEHEDEFKALYPGWDDIPDMSFEFIECKAISLKSKQLLEEWNSKNQLLATAICFRNPDYSLYVGLNLPREIYEAKAPILIRQEELHGFTKSINDEGQYSEVMFFGMNNIVYEENAIREKIAKKIHDNYLEQNKQNEETSEKEDGEEQKIIDPKVTEWADLPESYKWANRYIVEDYPIKKILLKRYSKTFKSMSEYNYLLDTKALYFSDIHINDFSNSNIKDIENERKERVDNLRVRLDNSDFNLFENRYKEKSFVDNIHLLVEDLELLSEVEHNRWCGERVMAKWAYGETKIASKRIHNCLLDYNKLQGEIKNYDRENVIQFLEHYSSLN